jgi:hypothetical protein
MARKKKTFIEMTNEEFMRIHNTDIIKFNMESLVWFKNKLKNYKINESEILRGELGKRRQKPSVGGMYFFRYQAKYDKELPYWDAFPLTIVFNEDAQHVWGINLHYLTPEARVVVFKRIMDIAGNKTISDAKKIKVTWEMLNSMAHVKWIQHAVKCYLKSNLRSMPVEVRPEEYSASVFLNVANFQKASQEFVWRDL